MKPEDLRKMTIQLVLSNLTDEAIEEVVPGFAGKPVVVGDTGERVGEVTAARSIGNKTIEADIAIDPGKVMTSYKQMENLSIEMIKVPVGKKIDDDKTD